jgi:hypothetical protein
VLRWFACFSCARKGSFLQWLPSTRGPHKSIIRLEVRGFPHSYCESRSSVSAVEVQRTIVSIANTSWFFIKLFGWRVGFEYPIVRCQIVYCFSTTEYYCTCESHCANVHFCGSFEKIPRDLSSSEWRTGSCDVSGDAPSWSKTESIILGCFSILNQYSSYTKRVPQAPLLRYRVLSQATTTTTQVQGHYTLSKVPTTTTTWSFIRRATRETRPQGQAVAHQVRSPSSSPSPRRWSTSSPH